MTCKEEIMPITNEQIEKLGMFFIETVGTWTDEKEKEAYKFSSLYLNDMSYTVFPEISEEDRNELVTQAEKFVAAD